MSGSSLVKSEEARCTDLLRLQGGGGVVLGLGFGGLGLGAGMGFKV